MLHFYLNHELHFYLMLLGFRVKNLHLINNSMHLLKIYQEGLIPQESISGDSSTKAEEN